VDNSAAFSDNGHTLVTSGHGPDGHETVNWWDTTTGTLVGSLPIAHGQSVIVADPDTRSVVTVGDSHVRLLDSVGTVRWTGDNPGPVRNHAVAPDASAIAVEGSGAVTVVDVPTGRSRTVRTDGGAAMWLSEGGRRLAVLDEGVQLFDVASGRKLSDLPVPVLVTNVRFGRDPDRVLVSSLGFDLADTGLLSLWASGGVTPVAMLTIDETADVVDQAFGLDGSTVVSIRCRSPRFHCDAPYDVRLWDVRSGTEVAVFPDLGRRLSGAAISQDGRMLATAWSNAGVVDQATRSDDRIRIWTLPGTR
jgi:WD40 repeat protein